MRERFSKIQIQTMRWKSNLRTQQGEKRVYEHYFVRFKCLFIILLVTQQISLALEPHKVLQENKGVVSRNYLGCNIEALRGQIEAQFIERLSGKNTVRTGIQTTLYHLQTDIWNPVIKKQIGHIELLCSNYMISLKIWIIFINKNPE